MIIKVSDKEILERIRKVKLVLCDVDGTLTIDRNTYLLHPEVINYIRYLEKNCVKVGLISGNTLPILSGIARYIGCTGGVAGENGSIVHYKDEIIIVCPKCSSVMKLAEIISRKLNGIAKRSWQDMFRLCDAAFKPVSREITYEKLTKIVEELIKELGYEDLVIAKSSGYAVHLIPKGCGKHLGALKLMELNKVDRNETLAIGDSITDLELLKVSGMPVAVSNADEKLKDIAIIVTSKPSAEGFIEMAKFILKIKTLPYDNNC